MAVPLFAELFILAVIVLPLLTLWALIDLLRRPEQQWKQAGQDRLVWALIVVFVGLIGPILYLTIGRSKLDGVTTSGETFSAI